MWPNLQGTADLVTFFEEILAVNPFLCSVKQSTQLAFQCRINVALTLWINVETTLTKVENETKFDVAFSTLHNLDTTSVSNVETMLKQRCITSFKCYSNLDTKLSQPCYLNVAPMLVQLYIENNPASNKH